MSLIESSKTRRGMAAASAAAMLTFAATLALANPVPPSAGIHTPSALSAQRAYAGGLTLDEAVTQAEKRYNAKVVKAETKQDGGRAVYELRLLSDDGRVWTIRVDAATGAGL